MIEHGIEFDREIGGRIEKFAQILVTHHNPIQSTRQFGAFVHDSNIFHVGIKAVSFLALSLQHLSPSFLQQQTVFKFHIIR